MKPFSIGAEGDLHISTWNGHRCIVKERRPKGYRNPQLDYRIRRARTVRESEILHQVKTLGVHAPLVYLADAANCRIILQYVRGRVVRDLPPDGLVSACRKIGGMVAAMHRGGIMHGDLTTSNFIVHGSRICALDFGLAQRTAKPEDHAIDLRLFKEILGSAHAETMEEAWDSFLAGYSEGTDPDRLARVRRLVSIIEGRGRYARVV